jgi:hypothetical protein
MGRASGDPAVFKAISSIIDPLPSYFFHMADGIKLIGTL